MKRLLIIIASFALVFGQDMSPEGQWKLTGLRVDYFDIARESKALVAHDSYGFGIAVPLAQIPAGALFNTTVNGPFSDQVLQLAGLNLNVNIYPDGTGAVGEGSYYPDVDLIPGTCITQGLIFPITDNFNWIAEGNVSPYPLTTIIGTPSANTRAGTYAEGFGVNGSGVFDNWPAEPIHIPTPSVLPGIGLPDGTYLAYGCQGVCGDPGVLANFGGDYALCVETCEGANDAGACAQFGTCLPGEWGGQYSTAPGQTSQMPGNTADVGFLLEWNAIDGWESESGLGDDLTLDEDGDGTDYDRIFGVPYISSTTVDASNPLCDITGGALTGAGGGLTYPIAGDIVTQLGGADVVGALVTSSCIEGTAATVEGYCLGAGGPNQFVYGSCLQAVGEVCAEAGGAYNLVYGGCLGQVQDGVEAQCDAADLDGDGVGTPVEAVTGLCVEASQGDDFAAGCAYYGPAASVTAACSALGFDDETCAAAGAQGAGAVEAYCDSLSGYPGLGCEGAGIDPCAILTDITFATGLCGVLAASLTTSETCEEWAASFDEAFLDENATQVLGVTCSEYAFGTTGYGPDDLSSCADTAVLDALAANDPSTGNLTCTDYAAVATGIPWEYSNTDSCGAFAAAAADAAFATSSGMTCTEYGASYVNMCVTGVTGANTFYVMDPENFATWGMFLTYNGASVLQYQAAGYDLATIQFYFPGLFVNDSGYDFNPACYPSHDDYDPDAGLVCAGRLVMDFEPTCVAEVEAHQIVAEFADLSSLNCTADGDVTGAHIDLPCNGTATDLYRCSNGSGCFPEDLYDEDGNLGDGCLDEYADVIFGDCELNDFYTGCECNATSYGECAQGAATTDDLLACAGEYLCYDGVQDPLFEAPGGDGQTDVIDIVRLVGHATGNPLGGEAYCSGDINGDGLINIIDIVAVVQIVLGGSRAENATETTIQYTENKIELNSNGYVGGIDITVEFKDESFDFELADNFYQRTIIDGNTARILMFADESGIEEVLNVTEGTIVSISDVIVANSSEEVTNVTYDQILPQAYVIKNAYPNPFNPVTTLSVKLNTAADVSVKVYNLTGQLVDVIAQGNFSPNTYNWTWNAENLASGVYFIATQIGNDINNQKVMLIK